MKNKNKCSNKEHARERFFNEAIRQVAALSFADFYESSSYEYEEGDSEMLLIIRFDADIDTETEVCDKGYPQMFSKLTSLQIERVEFWLDDSTETELTDEEKIKLEGLCFS